MPRAASIESVMATLYFVKWKSRIFVFLTYNQTIIADIRQRPVAFIGFPFSAVIGILSVLHVTDEVELRIYLI